MRPITPRQRAALASLIVAPMKRTPGAWEWRAHDCKAFALPTIAALRKKGLVAVVAGECCITASLTAKGKGVASNAA